MAVAPTPSLQRQGFEVDTSRKVTQLNVSQAGVVLYIPHPKFLLRTARHKLWRGWKKLQVAFLPAPLSVVLAFTSGVTYWVLTSKSSTWQRSGKLATLLWNIDTLLNPLAKYYSVAFRVGYLATLISGSAMYVYSAGQRFVLRQLLSYHGWLSERGAPSLATKVWGFLMKKVYLSRMVHQTMAYQGSLPTLPLPDLKTTVERHYKTIEPLLTTEERQEFVRKKEVFLSNEGPRLQRWLWLKWLTSSNYVSDWWLSLVYLRCRDSLCINSNWYGVTYSNYFPTHDQAARAAAVTFNLVNCKIQLDNEKFDPQLIGGTVPICMAQFQYAFSTTRVPGPEQDVLVKAEPSESRHIIVLRRGCYYKLDVFQPDSYRPLTPLQLAFAFEGILNRDVSVTDEEGQIPALTAMNRTEWHTIRAQYFLSDHFNRTHLEVIEKALFVVSLDHEAAPAAGDLSDEGRRYLCGNGFNRWSDKSFNLVILSNAKAGLHAEHSWGDAPALGHILEYTSISDEKKEFYGPDGHIKVSPAEERQLKDGTFPMYAAERILFQVNDGLRAAIRSAVAEYKRSIDDLDLHVVEYAKHGKKFVSKVAKMSPDAWVQMAMQLAYFRDQNRFDQTYESSMTRLFLEGRTETIRTVSEQSCTFVQLMLDSKATKDQRIQALRVAAEQHQAYSHLAMCGQGVDRHLFALYVVSVGKNTPSEYLKAAMGRKWKLSTSQVPTRQWPKEMHLPDEDTFKTPNGGFGPVADDGYGVSYSIYGENRFFFNVSSKRSAPNTDSARLAGRIFQALDDMAAMFA